MQKAGTVWLYFLFFWGTFYSIYWFSHQQWYDAIVQYTSQFQSYIIIYHATSLFYTTQRIFMQFLWMQRIVPLWHTSTQWWLQERYFGHTFLATGSSLGGWSRDGIKWLNIKITNITQRWVLRNHFSHRILSLWQALCHN